MKDLTDPMPMTMPLPSLARLPFPAYSEDEIARWAT